jgi:hypothetical protein
MKKNLAIPFLGVLLILLMAACIKDTDFEQANEVVLSPTVELDLIYFDLSASDFFDPQTSNSILTIRDTTELRFLSDTEIQDGLIRAEFFFRFTNSIPRSFITDFQFLSDENDTTYTAQTTILEGTIATPVVTEFTENVEGDAIADLTLASKVVVSVTIPSSNADLTGNLNLKSKTTYYTEFQ